MFLKPSSGTVEFSIGFLCLLIVPELVAELVDNRVLLHTAVSFFHLLTVLALQRWLLYLIFAERFVERAFHLGQVLS